ncbi:hypothetical protein KV557_00425 [Kitasatospora aureofaciens]|uniref:hypothetical protein n=1 Tax=Kitasatospora aureofaciens TaxID=1894 RepID=UPI001C469ABC|nr:hypothetical protein [Kitasatospora aureofaciens]MBV6695590.1 hypothetical protein [Kitasatospora aureofaciens]
MAPSTAVVRVSVSEPTDLWMARAYCAAGENVPLPQGVEEAVARWVACDLPGLDWRYQHDLDLATGHIAPAGCLPKAVC